MMLLSDWTNSLLGSKMSSVSVLEIGNLSEQYSYVGMVEDARKAIAEGREPALKSLTLPEGLAIPGLNIVPPPESASSVSTIKKDNSEVAETDRIQAKRFGLTPPKPTAIPSHLRTSSVQVEPATPPKWMTEQEAERAKSAIEGEAKEWEKAEDETPKASVPDVRELKEKKSGSFGRMDLAFVKKGPKKERPTGECLTKSEN